MKTSIKIAIIAILGITVVSSGFGYVYLLSGPFNDNYTENFKGDDHIKFEQNTEGKSHSITVTESVGIETTP